jgi:hypothetical protein
VLAPPSFLRPGHDATARSTSARLGVFGLFTSLAAAAGTGSTSSCTPQVRSGTTLPALGISTKNQNVTLFATAQWYTNVITTSVRQIIALLVSSVKGEYT